MLDVKLTLATGQTYTLTGTQSESQVLSPETTLESLVATAARTDKDRPGAPGVLRGRKRWQPLDTSMEFYLHADNGEDMAKLYKTFRQGWSMDKPCLLTINADHPLGTCYWDLWLAQEIPGVPVDMRRRTSTIVRVQVFNPGGLARTAVKTGTGIVTVNNPGVATIFPQLEYSGQGGPVTSPSGAVFTLPSVAAETTVDLDPQNLRLPGVFPEGVEPGDTQKWSLPAGVTAKWSVPIADPWA